MSHLLPQVSSLIPNVKDTIWCLGIGGTSAIAGYTMYKYMQVTKIARGPFGPKVKATQYTDSEDGPRVILKKNDIILEHQRIDIFPYCKDCKEPDFTPLKGNQEFKQFRLIRISVFEVIRRVPKHELKLDFEAELKAYEAEKNTTGGKKTVKFTQFVSNRGKQASNENSSTVRKPPTTSSKSTAMKDTKEKALPPQAEVEENVKKDLISDEINTVITVEQSDRNETREDLEFDHNESGLDVLAAAAALERDTIASEQTKDIPTVQKSFENDDHVVVASDVKETKEVGSELKDEGIKGDSKHVERNIADPNTKSSTAFSSINGVNEKPDNKTNAGVTNHGKFNVSLVSDDQEENSTNVNDKGQGDAGDKTGKSEGGASEEKKNIGVNQNTNNKGPRTYDNRNKKNNKRRY